MISRKANGKPDAGGKITEPYHCEKDIRDTVNWYDVYSLFGSRINGYEGNMEFEGHVDPDEFCYNINGNTGSFYLNYNDTILVQSNQGDFFHVIMHKRSNLKYKLFSETPEQYQYHLLRGLFCEYQIPKIFSSPIDSIEINNYINGFTMIDSKGIKYVFGNSGSSKENDNAIEFSRLGHDANSYGRDYVGSYKKYIEANAWHLTSIESPNGYKITLNYVRDNYITKLRFTDYAHHYYFATSTDGFAIYLANSLNACWADAIRSTLINGSCLEKIISPEGEIIFINYKPNGQLHYGRDYLDKLLETYTDSYCAPYKHLNQFFQYPDIYFANTNDTESVINDSFIPYKVNRIEVYKGHDEEKLIRTINFNYNFNPQVKTRLKLTSLAISENNTRDISASSIKYSFEYDPTPLPDYLTLKTDYYGFYNGKQIPGNFKNNDNSWAMSLSYNPEGIDIKKRPDLNYAKAEILTKIVYPTDGYSELEYEPHDYSKVCKTWPWGVRAASDSIDFTINDAGGLRIKSVKNFDSSSNLIQSKQYIYKTKEGNSSGVLVYKPVYVSLNQDYTDYDTSTGGSGNGNGTGGTGTPNSGGGDMPTTYPLDPNDFHLLEDWSANIGEMGLDYGENGDEEEEEQEEVYDDLEERAPINGVYPNNYFSKNIQFWRVSSNPIHSMESTRGSHITYSEVKVIEGTGGENNGYTVYRYKNYDNGYSDRPPKGYVTNLLSYIGNDYEGRSAFWEKEDGISMKHERGQPLSEEVCDNNGSIVKRTNYYYNNNPNRFKEQVRYIKKVNNNLEFNAIASMLIMSGVHYTYHPYLREKRDVLYFASGDSLVTTVTNQYNEKYRLLKSTQTVDSRGELLKTQMFYPFEQIAGNPVHAAMTERFMLAYSTGSKMTRNNENIIETEIKYASGLAANKPNLILPSEEYVKHGNASKLLAAKYNEYDDIGNPLSITDKSGEKICYLWSYNGSLPIAKIVGLNYTEVKNIIGTQVINNLWSNQNPTVSQIQSARNSLSGAGAMVTTYTYEPLIGMMTETDFRGVTTYYEYDELGRLKEIKVGQRNSPAQTSDVQKKIESYEYHYREGN